MKQRTTAFAAALLALALVLSGCGIIGFGGGQGGGTTTAHEDAVTTPRVTEPPETEPLTTEPETTADPIRFSKEPLTLELTAKQSFVYNVNTGEFLYLTGRGERIVPASTTKLLTIVYALTLIDDPSELVTPGDELSLVNEHSSLAYVRPNHTLTVEMLIEGMLLPSGNDAAYVLACAAGRKLSDDPKGIPAVDAVALFIDGMNEYANSIGMTGSHFTCPDGYPDEDHYSTVEDMAIISAIAVKNSIIKKYARILVDNVVYASQHTNKWTNSNKLLDPSGEFYSPYATGLKTGSADNNYSFIASADIEGVTYIAGFFTEEHPNDRFVDALTVIKALEDRLP